MSAPNNIGGKLHQRKKIIMSDLKQDRLNICAGCEYNKGGDCMICGCSLDYKTGQPEESCPLSPGSKWGAVVVHSEPPIGALTQEAPRVIPPPRPPCKTCTKRR